MPSPSLTRVVPSLEEQEFLEERLYEFNRDRVGRDDGRMFAFFVRDEQQEIVAGVCGWTWAGACEIRSLWVHEALRGQGHGRALLEAAEGEALARGCRAMLVATYSFQAPAFYEKQGFEVAWRLEDFPPGHQDLYLVKRLGAG